MTARKAQPRLTRADERAIAKLLAGADQVQVDHLAGAINRYENMAAEAKARLTRRRVWRRDEEIWHGGYANAMETIAAVICETAGEDPRYAVLAVMAVAAGHRDLYYAYGVPEPWPGDAS